MVYLYCINTGLKMLPRIKSSMAWYTHKHRRKHPLVFWSGAYTVGPIPWVGGVEIDRRAEVSLVEDEEEIRGKGKQWNELRSGTDPRSQKSDRISITTKIWS